MSEVITLDDRDEAVSRALAALRRDELVVVPADSTYVLAANAFSILATQRLLGAKRRSRIVPLSVMIRSPRQVMGLVEDIPEAAERLMAAYWPGPVTLVLRAADGLTWDLGESHGTVALQMPAQEFLIELITEVGPLASSGANRSGSPVPATADEAREQLGDVVALYVDGGERRQRLSTIVDVTGATAEVLREGAVATEHVRLVASGDTGWGQQPSDDEQPVANEASPEQQEES